LTEVPEIAQQENRPEKNHPPVIDTLGKGNDTRLGAVIALLIVVIFIFDIVTPLSLVVWTLYLLPLFLTVYARQRFAPVYVAFAVILLSIIGIFLSYPDVPITNALVNRVFFSMVIAVIASFIWNYRENVSALGESREELRQANALLTSHMDNSPLAIIEFDAQFRITRWTGEATRIFGWTADEVMGKAIGEFPWVYEEDVSRVTAISAAMLEGKSPSNMHANRNYRKDGTVLECEWYNSALRDVEGNLVSIFSQVLDVTARNRAEAEIRKKNIELNAANEELTAAQEELRQNVDELGKKEQELTEKNEEMNALNEELTSNHEELVQNFDELARVETALREANERLEQRVAERTLQLEKAVNVAGAERKRLYDVLDTLPAYVCLLDENYHIPFANRYFRETFGESHGRCCYDFLFNKTAPCETCETYTVMKTRAPHHWYWTGPNGRDYDIYDFPFNDTDGSFLILEMGIDITERNKAEKALREAHDVLEARVQERTKELRQKNEDLNALNKELTATQEELRQNLEELTLREEDLSKALAEKEVLLSEIHHRVKNNLTAFISLLSLEGAYQDTPDGRALRLDLQNRARSMALVHETLYRTHMYNEVDMGVYLTNLIDQIENSFKTQRSVKTVVDAHGIMLDIPRATPAGLIINELMTNALKHAFPESATCGTPGSEPCTFRVEFAQSNGFYTLSVSDNGIGLPASIDIKTTKSLGLKLVHFLAKHQLRASIDIDTSGGTKYTFRFEA
jgi:PAS domain S-box-containing protein